MKITTIRENNDIKQNFKAKIYLNKIKSNYGIQEHFCTKLDSCFNESAFSLKLQNLAIFIRRKIGNKFFSNPDNKIGNVGKEFINLLVNTSRRSADLINQVQNYSDFNDLNKKFINTDTNSSEYIKEISRIGNSIDNKYIITNTESHTLENIAKSKESCIFVLNHPTFIKDKFVYLILNSMLNKEYVKEGIEETCPRPKVLVSKYMLKLLGKKTNNIYKHLGLVPIDPAVDKTKRNLGQNAGFLKKVLEEIIDNKSNLFIFPEGNNSGLKEKTFKERIQPGIASLIKNIVTQKGSIRVVPVGINYTSDKDCLGQIFVGEPLIFNKKSGKTVINEKNKFTEYPNSKNLECNILNKISQKLCFCVKKAKNLE